MKAGKPKGIKIEDNSSGTDLDFRLYKVWPKKNVSKEPFLVTSDVADMIETYCNKIKEWGVKPDMKLLYKLAKQYEQKDIQNGQSNFLKDSIK